MFLLARAFSSGCAALTGVEAISNSVPRLHRRVATGHHPDAAGPDRGHVHARCWCRWRRSSTSSTSTRTTSTRWVQAGWRVHSQATTTNTLSHRRDRRRRAWTTPAASTSSSSRAAWSWSSASNTTFNQYPVLGRSSPRTATRALGHAVTAWPYSGGIASSAHCWRSCSSSSSTRRSTRLIQLYIVGVFVSFNLSQLGMIRHWTRCLGRVKNLRQSANG